jgi:hypothetical protein
MEKKLALLLAICLLLICASGCFSNNVYNQDYKDPDAKITFLQYTWDGWGISVKYLGESEVTDRIITALDTMKETGETVKKISNDVISIGSVSKSLPVERGTMWMEIGDNIYRLTPDLSQLYLVETHFGKGKVLAITDEFKTDVNSAWNYAPYDYFIGEYHQGDETVELTNVFQAASTVKLSIKDIKVEREYDPQNTITVELISTIDQEVTINLRCQQSDDNMALGSSKSVSLEKDTPTTVELTFGGWPNTYYWIYLKVANTRVEMKIQP